MILARGFVSSSQQAIFVAKGREAHIDSVTLFSTGGAQTITGYFNKDDGAPASQFGRWVLGANESAEPIDTKEDEKALRFGVGDSIEMQTSLADTVAYTVWGTYLE